MPIHTGARARSWLARRLRRRPPFWLALVLVVGGFTALTGSTIGFLAWWENRETSRVLLDTAMARTARLATDQAEEFLRSAESAARLGSELVRTGTLDPDDARALERFTLATLRAHPGISWVSYGGADDRFVGAWRDAGGTVHVNRSFPVDGTARRSASAASCATSPPSSPTCAGSRSCPRISAPRPSSSS